MFKPTLKTHFISRGF